MRSQTSVAKIPRGAEISGLVIASREEVARVAERYQSLNTVFFESAAIDLGGDGTAAASRGATEPSPMTVGRTGAAAGAEDKREALASDARPMEERKHHLPEKGAERADRQDGAPRPEEKAARLQWSEYSLAFSEVSLPSLRAEFFDGINLRRADFAVQYLAIEGESEKGITGSLLKPRAGGAGGGILSGGGAVYGPAAGGFSGPPPGYFAALAAHDANQSGLAKLAAAKPDQAAIDFERAQALNPLNPEYGENLSKARAEEAAQRLSAAEQKERDRRDISAPAQR